MVSFPEDCLEVLGVANRQRLEMHSAALEDQVADLLVEQARLLAGIPHSDFLALVSFLPIPPMVPPPDSGRVTPPAGVSNLLIFKV